MFLRNSADEGSFPKPAETQAIADRLLKRVQLQVGESVRDLNVFRNVGSFVVEASPRLLRTLIDQEEVRSATPNRPTHELEPVDSAR